MRRKGISARLASLLLAVVCVAALLPAAPANAIGMGNVDVSFSDVPEGSWYHDYVYLCASWGIIDGKENGQFCPTDSLKRGEFMKLLTLIGGLAPYTWDTSVHWSQPYWQILNDNGVLWGLDITCTRSALEQPITRYEMSVMINNLCNNVYSETPVTMESPASVIGDYNTMASKYHEPVVQAYGKGILDGYDDGMFHGESTLTRGQAAAVVVRTWITSERLEVSSATEVETPTGGDSSSSMNPTDSFAWRSRSMIDAWGKVSAEGRQLLFGDSNKSCFTGNESNLSDYIVTIQVRTWDINSGEQDGRGRGQGHLRGDIQRPRAVPHPRARRREVYGLPAPRLGLRHRHQPGGELLLQHHHEPLHGHHRHHLLQVFGQPLLHHAGLQRCKSLRQIRLGLGRRRRRQQLQRLEHHRRLHALLHPGERRLILSKKAAQRPDMRRTAFPVRLFLMPSLYALCYSNGKR